MSKLYFYIDMFIIEENENIESEEEKDENFIPENIETDDESLMNESTDIEIKENDSEVEDIDYDIKKKTSVTGDALQENMEKMAKKNNIDKLFDTEDTHLTADRASTNVKAGRQMKVKFTSGALHGFGRKVWSSHDLITSKKWRKRGQRKKVKNPNYRPKVAKVLNQARDFARFVIARKLNGNFKPKHKIIKKIRWNILCTHLHPFTKYANQKMVKKVRKYWIKNKKMKGKKKK
eukprot:191016_1